MRLAWFVGHPKAPLAKGHIARPPSIKTMTKAYALLVFPSAPRQATITAIFRSVLARPVPALVLPV
ncbi:hypothetical protein MAXJ12_34249 [Mesorhizobium alhagi CCNWXJ12-2]|uniref:Uncharacterized protein n=1 Tax=Mesorhizobium alhagi CCNWXJ12-2 TaxID=1107882 RepID=H0I2Z2_9HYPH|nr:hypothetical protein MAXJ12_34249 [Mesorhizobium alhagi CCNWXJ12-2]